MRAKVGGGGQAVGLRVPAGVPARVPEEAGGKKVMGPMPVSEEDEDGSSEAKVWRVVVGYPPTVVLMG